MDINLIWKKQTTTIHNRYRLNKIACNMIFNYTNTYPQCKYPFHQNTREYVTIRLFCLFWKVSCSAY